MISNGAIMELGGSSCVKCRVWGDTLYVACNRGGVVCAMSLTPPLMCILIVRYLIGGQGRWGRGLIEEVKIISTVTLGLLQV